MYLTLSCPGLHEKWLHAVNYSLVPVLVIKYICTARRETERGKYALHDKLKCNNIRVFKMIRNRNSQRWENFWLYGYTLQAFEEQMRNAGGWFLLGKACEIYEKYLQLFISSTHTHTKLTRSEFTLHVYNQKFSVFAYTQSKWTTCYFDWCWAHSSWEK